VPLVFASVTGLLVKLATNVIGSLGLAGVALLTVTSGVIGVPGTEATMLFAGFNVWEGRFSLLAIVAAGVVGDVIAAAIAYAIGYRGSRELLERRGSKLHVKPERLDSVNRWFERYGSPVIFASRSIPFVRAVVPYAAGVGRIGFTRFIALAALGSIPWFTGLGLLGREVGRNWQSWRGHLEYADYAAIVLVAGAVAYLVLRRIRATRLRPAVDAASK
jgi:membrane protein DedA with SNARE-associated domain